MNKVKDLQINRKFNADYSTLATKNEVSAAAAGIIGGVNTFADLLGSPPSWADNGSGAWKDGSYIVRNDNNSDHPGGDVAGVNKPNNPTSSWADTGQLYATSDNGTTWYWTVAWPYADDDIIIESTYTDFLKNVSGRVNNALEAIDTRVAYTSATSDPTGNNDAVDTAILGREFSVGSKWYNATSKTLWICMDDTATSAVWVEILQDAIVMLVDGNGFTIVDGQKTPFAIVPFNCTIVGWKVRASASDTFNADIEYNATLGSAPSTITGGGTTPNVSGANNGSGTNLASWTTSLAKGGVITVNISGTPSSATWATVSLDVVRRNVN